MTHKSFIPVNNPSLVQELQHKQRNMDALLEMTKAINSNQSTVELFELYVDILKTQFNYSTIFILYKTKSGWFVCQNKNHEHLEDLDLVEYLAPFKELTYLSKNETKLGEYDTIVPVFHKKEALAYVMIEGVYNQIVDTIEEEVRFVETLTNIVVIAAENKRLFRQEMQQKYEQRELQLAADIQQALIPKSFPNHINCEFAAEYLPHSTIGGDSFDIYPHPTENAFFVTIADVSGKGVSAAILMANFQAYLRSAILNGKDPFTFAQKINSQVKEITNGDKFISLAVIKIEFDQKQISYINFGHNPPMLLTGNQIHHLHKGSTIIGVFDELPFFEVGIIPLEGQSTLFAYTDGLIDTLNNSENQGEQDLVKVLQNSLEDSPATINNLIKDMIDYQESKFTDDITFLTARISI